MSSSINSEGKVNSVPVFQLYVSRFFFPYLRNIKYHTSNSEVT